ncbi:MAG: ABC transporter substrate-binding protein [Proteobacteria bacterium]|nr:ABC transporter substrate-binding protein [Pseudomonadota bacterium]
MTTWVNPSGAGNTASQPPRASPCSIPTIGQSLKARYAKVVEEARGAKSTDTHPVGTNAYMFDDHLQGNLKQKPHPNIRMVVMNKPHLTFLMINHTKGPCQDLRVRQAISHTIDRKALIHGAMFGLARPASCIYPSDQWSHNPNLKAVGYDPEKARKPLAEAGYEKGLSIKGYANNNPGTITITAALQNMLAKVGIDWKAEILDSTAADDRRKNLEYDIGTGVWSYMFDPDRPATGLYHPKGGFNDGRSHNEKAIKLIDAGREELDPEKRKNIYWEMEKALYDNYEDLWLWHARAARDYHKNIGGVDSKMEERYMGTWRRSHSLAMYMWFNEKPQ